jgi:hypothetical protein
MASEPTNGVSVQTFATRDAAEVAASLLRSNGIASRIFADDCGGLYPNLSLAEGVHLVVSPSDVESARELLDLPCPAQRPVEQTTAEKSSPLLFPLALIVIGAAVGALIVSSYRGITNPRPAATPRRQTHDEYSPDGKRSDRWVYRDGVLIEHFEDRNRDGEWDYWAYYEDGWVSRVEYDDNFDGQSDVTYRYKDRQLVSVERDSDFNGVPDEFCSYQHGILQEVDIRPNGSKFSITREFFSNAVLTEIQRGGDSHGNFKETVKYDAFFNPISTNLTTYPLLRVR